MRSIPREWCAIGVAAIVLVATLCGNAQAQQPLTSSSDLASLLAPGGLLQDRNGDGVIDFVNARISLGERPSAADVSAAANLAARLGFETMAMNLPLSSTPEAGATAFLVGREGVRRSGVTPPARMASLRPGEGMIAVTTSGTPSVIVAGADDAGTMAAAAVLAGRLPHVWDPEGKSLSELASDVRTVLGDVGSITIPAVIVRAGGDEIQAIDVAVTAPTSAAAASAVRTLRQLIASPSTRPAGTLSYPGAAMIRIEIRRRRCKVFRRRDSPHRRRATRAGTAASRFGVERKTDTGEPLHERRSAGRLGQQSHRRPLRPAALSLRRRNRRHGGPCGPARSRIDGHLHSRRAASGSTRKTRGPTDTRSDRNHTSARRLAGHGEEIRAAGAAAGTRTHPGRPEGFWRQERSGHHRCRRARPCESASRSRRAAPARLGAWKGSHDARRHSGRCPTRPVGTHAGGSSGDRPVQAGSRSPRVLRVRISESAEVVVSVEKPADGFAEVVRQRAAKIKADRVNVVVDNRDVQHAKTIFDESFDIPSEVDEFWKQFRSKVLPAVKKSQPVIVEAGLSESPEMRAQIEKDARAELDQGRRGRLRDVGDGALRIQARLQLAVRRDAPRGFRQVDREHHSSASPASGRRPNGSIRPCSRRRGGCSKCIPSRTSWLAI